MIRYCAIGVAALSSCYGTMACADTVDLRYLGRGDGWGQRLLVGGSEMNNVFAGELMHAFSNGTGAGAQFNGRTLATFCTDLFQHASSAGATYDLVDPAVLPDPGTPMGSERADAIGRLFAYRSSMMDAGFETSTASRNFQSAFQLAIWEIVYEFDPTNGGSLPGTLDLESGNFSATQTSGNRLSRGIRNFFNDITTTGINFNASRTVVGLRSGENQDQIVESIPLPNGALAGAAGLGLVATRRRR